MITLGMSALGQTHVLRRFAWRTRHCRRKVGSLSGS